jgi:hypothetical protein
MRGAEVQHDICELAVGVSGDRADQRRPVGQIASVQQVIYRCAPKLLDRVSSG